jgi:hypothetical protein
MNHFEEGICHPQLCPHSKHLLKQDLKCSWLHVWLPEYKSCKQGAREWEKDIFKSLEKSCSHLRWGHAGLRYLSMEPLDVWVEKFPTKPWPKPPVTFSWPGRKLDPDILTMMEAIEFVCQALDIQEVLTTTDKVLSVASLAYLGMWRSCVHYVDLNVSWDISSSMLVIENGNVSASMGCQLEKALKTNWKKKQDDRIQLPESSILVDWKCSVESKANSGCGDEFTLEVVHTRIGNFHPSNGGSLFNIKPDLS